MLNLVSTGMPWRALRPLFLAGAAAMAWLALSAPAATADTASDPASLPGSISSSVSSLTSPSQPSLGNTVSAARAVRPAKATAPVPAPAPGPVVPAVAPAPGALASVARAAGTEPAPRPGQAGLPQPLAGNVAGSADQLVDAVPLLEQVVPTGTVDAVIAPASGAVDTVVETAAKALLLPAGAALPVLEPVLQPVGDVLTGGGGLQVPVPGAGQVLAPVIMAPAGLRGFEAGSGPVAGRILPDGTPLSAAGTAGGVPAWAYAASAPVGSAGPGSSAASAGPSDATESPADGDWIPGPEALPAAPSSGAGSGQSSASPAGAAAWLSDLSLDAPRPDAFPISGPLQSAPSPVSFDPGSSPD